jgi:hypothetical protein
MWTIASDNKVCLSFKTSTHTRCEMELHFRILAPLGVLAPCYTFLNSAVIKRLIAMFTHTPLFGTLIEILDPEHIANGNLS